MQQDENSPIEVTDQPPQGMEFFVEGKQLRAIYQGKNINMQNFAVLKIDNGRYYSTDVVSNDDYLDLLMAIFTDQISIAKDIKESLENPLGRGMAGNEIRITVEDQKITINYLYDYDQFIIIDRQELIKVMQKVITLMEARAPYITLIRDTENSPIEVTDRPPQGMEFFVENKFLKARYKGKIYT